MGSWKTFKMDQNQRVKVTLLVFWELLMIFLRFKHGKKIENSWVTYNDYMEDKI